MILHLACICETSPLLVMLLAGFGSVGVMWHVFISKVKGFFK